MWIELNGSLYNLRHILQIEPDYRSPGDIVRIHLVENKGSFSIKADYNEIKEFINRFQEVKCK